MRFSFSRNLCQNTHLILYAIVLLSLLTAIILVKSSTIMASISLRISELNGAIFTTTIENVKTHI